MHTIVLQIEQNLPDGGREEDPHNEITLPFQSATEHKCCSNAFSLSYHIVRVQLAQIKTELTHFSFWPTMASSSTDNDCIICWDPVTTREVYTPCLHKFHWECWLKHEEQQYQNDHHARVLCPICRQDPILLASQHKPICHCFPSAPRRCKYSYFVAGWICFQT